MKVIKIADKSQYSWATVQEYLSDELASDSEDEKRLFRSERRAEKKVKDSKKKRSPKYQHQRFQPYPPFNPNHQAKLAKLKRSLESMILDGYATYRELARLAGFIISLSLAVGPIARLFTRQMYFLFSPGPRGMSRLPFPRPYCKSLSFGFSISILLMGILLGVSFVPSLLFMPMLAILHSAAI
ncbi:unnamed protein product [Porites lobata]|uniref:PRA1 family protein n=1 Tax=Porites lobata TaxID=104759 RepID=A0ABN8P6C7_9CNID|nr:unnamed protein product [Porites lobata]